jgi:hypothetical protein
MGMEMCHAHRCAERATRSLGLITRLCEFHFIIAMVQVDEMVRGTWPKVERPRRVTHHRTVVTRQR